MLENREGTGSIVRRGGQSLSSLYGWNSVTWNDSLLFRSTPRPLGVGDKAIGTPQKPRGSRGSRRAAGARKRKEKTGEERADLFEGLFTVRYREMLWGDGRGRREAEERKAFIKYWKSRWCAIGGPQMGLSIGGRSDHADRLMGSVSRGVRLVLSFKSPDFFPRLQCGPDTVNQWRFPSPC